MNYSGVTQWYAVTIPVTIEKGPEYCPPLSTESFCSGSVFAPFPVHSSLPSVFARLQKYLSLPLCCSSAASQGAHTSIVAQVLSAHTQSPSFSKCFTTRLRLNVYQALLPSQSLIITSVITRIVERVPWRPVCSLPQRLFALKGRNMNHKSSRKKLTGRVSG